MSQLPRFIRGDHWRFNSIAHIACHGIETTWTHCQSLVQQIQIVIFLMELGHTFYLKQTHFEVIL